MSALSAVHFPLGVGDPVKIIRSTGSHPFHGAGSTGIIKEKVIRETSEGIFLSYVLKGSTEEVPIRCCVLWEKKNG